MKVVNEPPTGSGAVDGRGVERRMILSYAPATTRRALVALLALDDALAAILRSTRDPMIGQMRLTWWHDALTALDTCPPPAEPVLQALTHHVIPHVSGALLAKMVEGWEELLDPEPLDDDRLQRFADLRGGRLFAAAGRALGSQATDPLVDAGRGWALVDLSMHVRDDRVAERARTMAVKPLGAATARRWSRQARPLGAMAHLARMDVNAGPARVARALWHRLTGH